jgi:hypothetical protein
VSSHGDDGDTTLCQLPFADLPFANQCQIPGSFVFPNHGGCFKSIHFRHLHIHQNQIEELAFPRCQSLFGKTARLPTYRKCTLEMRTRADSEQPCQNQPGGRIPRNKSKPVYQDDFRSAQHQVARDKGETEN